MVRLRLSLLIVIRTRVNGKIIKHMVLEFTGIIQVPFMRDIGQTTCKTVSVSKSGTITVNTKAPISTEESMDRGNTHGLTAAITKGHGRTTKSKGMESMYGAMAEVTRAIGRTIRCMVMEFMCGRMGGSMREIICMTKSKVRASTTGRMGRDLRADGLMGSDKGWGR